MRELIALARQQDLHVMVGVLMSPTRAVLHCMRKMGLNRPG